MCDDGYFEIDWRMKCKRCGKKPAVWLGKVIPKAAYSALCEKCGIEVYGENIVTDWAGTELYLAKYPEEREVYQ